MGRSRNFSVSLKENGTPRNRPQLPFLAPYLRARRPPARDLPDGTRVEIDIPALEKLSNSKKPARPFVDEYTMKDGRRIYLLAEGRLVNLSAAEGHPAAVMDMSFANQALAAEYMMKHSQELQPQVYPVPEPIDQHIAKIKLESMGVHVDKLTPEQEHYLASWSEGT